MPQMTLPIFPTESTLLSATVAVQKKDGHVYYFQGPNPVFVHPADDIASFRMFTSQLYDNGHCSQMDIVRAFGVTQSSVKRAVKKYRAHGPSSFFERASPVRKPRVLTDEVLERAQSLLNAGKSREEVARELDIKPNTFNKAIHSGRLTVPVQPAPPSLQSESSSKSERSEADSQPAMGMACHRVMERIAATRGDISEAETRFEPAHDVPNGGVLCALPALLENGLLKGVQDYLNLPSSFYGLTHLLLLLAFMALARIKNVERLRYEPPGEWGKLLGLDRIPEVRIVREKINHIADHSRVSEWGSALSTDWMTVDPCAVGVIYTDGHPRPYYGKQTKLPRRRMARLRLCLRSMSDYWVNDRHGRPLFVVSTPLTSGILATLKTDVVPRLLKEMPNQPTEEELQANPCLHRFVMVIDREGYSPDFFKEMWDEHRIACQTYHKYPGDDWKKEDFADYLVTMPAGYVVKMKLAEKRTRLNNDFEVREIRKLNDNGHQTSIISMDLTSDLTVISGHMFGRWCQENFFKYMMENFDIDKLISYKLEDMDESRKVVNPAWRKLDNQVRSKAAKLNKMKVEFSNLTLGEGLKKKDMEAFELQKGQLHEDIAGMERDIEDLKAARKKAKRHIAISELPDDDRFKQIAPTRKQFIDTIKMIAYRAETAMAGILRDILFRTDDTRSLLRDLYTMEADIIPNKDDQTLTVRLHHFTNAMSDRAIQNLLDYLNDAEVIYPGTDLKMVYKLGRGDS
jgi:transposase-like protein